MSETGDEQQISAMPSAGGSMGSGEERSRPSIKPLSQLWHTPVRHDHRTGTEHASSNSSKLLKRTSQRAASLLLANVTSGPDPSGPIGKCGDWFGAPTTPGVRAPAGPNASL